MRTLTGAQATITSYDPNAPKSQQDIDLWNQHVIAQQIKAKNESSIGYGIVDKAALTVQMIPGVKQMLGNEKAIHINGEEATTDETVGGMINTAAFFVPLTKAKVAVEIGEAVVKQTGQKLLNQFNSAESLIDGAGILTKIKAGLQGFVKGDGPSIFNAITQGSVGTTAKGGYIMRNGNIISKYFSSTSGDFTIFINKGSEMFKIRITP